MNIKFQEPLLHLSGSVERKLSSTLKLCTLDRAALLVATKIVSVVGVADSSNLHTGYSKHLLLGPWAANLHHMVVLKHHTDLFCLPETSIL